MTNNTHPLRCKCGLVHGHVDTKGVSNRVICYCKDCQAFARFLGNPHDVLDINGGTEIIQVAPSRVTLIQGLDQLAAIRLTNRGLLRWYTKCCNTPIGNTLPNYKPAFVGLIHSCLAIENPDRSFGKVRAHVNTRSAAGKSPPREDGIIGALIRFILIVAAGRLTGSFKHTPFFLDSGRPVAVPVVLEHQELKRLKRSG